MSADLTNLLPQERKRFLSRDYLFRLGTVVVLLATLLTLIHGLLLTPAYLYAQEQLRAHEMRLAALQASATGPSEEDVRNRVTALEKQAKQLANLGSQTTASGAVRAILSAPRPGIQIYGFTYTPSSAVDANKMTLNGTAATREALRTYLGVLDALPYVAKAELPISAYAKERDISFTITLTGSLRP